MKILRYFFKTNKKKEIEEIILFLPESKNVNEIAKILKINFAQMFKLQRNNTKTAIYTVKDC